MKQKVVWVSLLVVAAAVAGDPVSGTLIENVWQAGAPSAYTSSSGIFPCREFFYFGSTGIGLNLHMESCGNGCPAPNSTLAVLAQQAVDMANGDRVGFLLATANETPTNSVNFDYSTDPLQLVRLPTPVVVNSCYQCPPGNEGLVVAVRSVAGGLYGPNAAAAVTGYRIMTALSAGNPGNDASACSVAATIAVPGGIGAVSDAFTVSCPTTGGKDAWIATQLSFENGAIVSQVGSAPKRVHCGGSLADPKGK